MADPGFLLYGKIFAENSMKLKEFGPRRVARVPSAGNSICQVRFLSVNSYLHPLNSANSNFCNEISTLYPISQSLAIFREYFWTISFEKNLKYLSLKIIAQFERSVYWDI